MRNRVNIQCSKISTSNAHKNFNGVSSRHFFFIKIDKLIRKLVSHFKILNLEIQFL